MKKFLKILGSAVLLIASLFVAIAIYSAYKANEYSKTAIPYVKRVVPQISSWDYEVSKSFMTDEVLASTNDDELKKLMNWFRKLGTLKSMEEPSFVNVSSNASIQSGKQTIATFTVVSHYENGDALVTISLVEIGSDFKIYRFHINSPALIE